MSLSIKIRHGIRNYWSFFFFLFLWLLILFVSSCQQKPEPYSILEFTGSEAVVNYSKSFYMVSHKSDSVNPASLLASEGDLIFYGDEFYIYRKSAGNKFHFKTSSEGGYVNGKITTLNMQRRNDVTPWFKQMKTADLSALEFLKIDSAIPEDYYPYLTDLAKIKPGIGLYYDGDIKDISRAVKLFNPRYLIGEIVYGSDFSLLSELKNLELLVVALDDSVDTGPLPAMPSLKHLIITNVSDKIVLNDKFLSENKTLERLTLFGSKKIDFSLLNPLNTLKALVIGNFNSVINSDLIKNHASLELLSVIGDKSEFNMVTDGLKGIRWMTFSPDVSQKAFNSFINNHLNLEVAEILDNDTISSLNPLLKLKNLRGLTISDTLTDLASVKSLKNLKYLSLPAYVLKDKIVKDDLQKLMPGTVIDANEGFCLGSGWLLLIVPLILFFSMLSQRKFRKSDNPV